MWLSLRSLVLISFFLFCIGLTYAASRRPETLPSKSKNRLECWYNGGVVSNRVHELGMEIDNIAEGALKVRNNGTVNEPVAYNFGTLFDNADSKLTMSPVPSSASALDEAQILHFMKDENIAWRKPAKTRMEVYCQEDYEEICATSFVLDEDEDEEEVTRFLEANCTELYGDLIINYIDERVVENLKRIRNIHGKLVISNVNSPLGIDFEKLTEVGDYQYEGTSSSIQVTDNQLKHINFPALVDVHCHKETGRYCVKATLNFPAIKNPTTAIFSLANKNMYEKIERIEKRVAEGEKATGESASVASAQELTKNNVEFTDDGWEDEVLNGIPAIHIVIAILSILGCIAVAVWIVLLPKWDDYDEAGIDKLVKAAEDLEQKDPNEEKEKTEKSKGSNPTAIPSV